jgi:hypothetical protein
MHAVVALLGGWRATLFAVLAVAACVACFLFAGRYRAVDARADAAESRAVALAQELEASKAALQREQAASEATEAARTAAEARYTEHMTRADRVEGYARAPRADLCTPDADLVRELGEGQDRIRAAEDRLRSLRRTEGENPGDARSR